MPAQSRQHANSQSAATRLVSKGKKKKISWVGLGQVRKALPAILCHPDQRRVCAAPWVTHRACISLQGNSLPPCREEMRKQPKRGTAAESQSHKPSLSCYADSAYSGKVSTALAVCWGMLDGGSKPQGQQPGDQHWGSAPLLLRFCLLSPAAASSSSPPPRRACPQRCHKALTEERAGDGVPVLVLLLEVPELLGLLAHVDGQSGPHHPTDRAASERSARRIAQGPWCSASNLLSPVSSEKTEQVTEFTSKQRGRGIAGSKKGPRDRYKAAFPLQEGYSTE